MCGTDKEFSNVVGFAGSPEHAAMIRGMNLSNSEEAKRLSAAIAASPMTMRSMANAEYVRPMIPVACRIFGHKWTAKEFTEYFDSTGMKHRNTVHRWLSHCSRCGEANPIRKLE